MDDLRDSASADLLFTGLALLFQVEGRRWSPTLAETGGYREVGLLRDAHKATEGRLHL
jgi:hypothetical protein